MTIRNTGNVPTDTVAIGGVEDDKQVARVTNTNPGANDYGLVVRVVGGVGGGGGGGGTGDASAFNQEVQIAQVGDHITDAPDALTVLGRLREIANRLGAAVASPAANTINAGVKAIIAALPAGRGTQTVANSMSVAPATAATFPVSGTVTANLGTLSGAATEAAQETGNTTLTTISGKLPAALGQRPMATSMAVVMASDQSAVPVSGTVTANLGTLSGAATEVAQETGNTTLTAINGKLPASLGQRTMATSLAVTMASNQSAVPVSGTVTANLGTIAGVATETTQAAGNTTLTAISGKLPAALGQRPMASSLAVVMASDQSAVPVSIASTVQRAVTATLQFTRPANTTQYAPGDALYNSTTAGAAQQLPFVRASDGSVVPVGSLLVVTNAQIIGDNATATVNNLIDLFLSPTTFTPVADNAGFNPGATALAGGFWVPFDYPIILPGGGAVSYSNDLAVQFRLPAAASSMFVQARLRTAYIPQSGETITIRLAGFEVV
jgi:3D (Asp-Asp-Asp) domain-containing protein